MTERDEQQQRHDLFEMLGVLADVTDVLRAIAASSRLASKKLERHCAILTKLAIATGEPAED